MNPVSPERYDAGLFLPPISDILFSKDSQKDHPPQIASGSHLRGISSTVLPAISPSHTLQLSSHSSSASPHVISPQLSKESSPKEDSLNGRIKIPSSPTHLPHLVPDILTTPKSSISQKVLCFSPASNEIKPLTPKSSSKLPPLKVSTFSNLEGLTPKTPQSIKLLESGSGPQPDILRGSNPSTPTTNKFPKIPPLSLSNRSQSYELSAQRVLLSSSHSSRQLFHRFKPTRAPIIGTTLQCRLEKLLLKCGYTEEDLRKMMAAKD